MTKPTTFTAAQTWVSNGSGYWPALMIRRTNYSDGAALDTGPFIYPASPSASNYFVPIAMKVYQTQETGYAPGNIWVVATGYGPAAAYGQTDIRTVAFNGYLTFRWDNAFSKIVTSGSVMLPSDEHAVDLDVSPDNIAVTGNVWTGYDWNIESVFYKLNGKELGSFEQGGSGNDFAAGVRINHAQGGTAPDSYTEALVTGTVANSGSGTSIFGYRYYQDGDLIWHAGATRQLTTSGAEYVANTMTAYRPQSESPGTAVVVGKVSGIDFTNMLMVKFNFANDDYSWHASFDAPAHGIEEAFAVTTNTGYFAMGGRGYRGTTFGSDALVVLYKEVTVEGVPQPELQWSAWMNSQSETGTVTKTCTALAIDEDDTVSDRSLIYAAGQKPNGSNVDWRVGVFHSGVSSDPPDPLQKGFFGNTLSVAGTGSGNDAPVHIEFSPITSPYLHMFLVTGNIYNGSTDGDDVTVRKYRFQP